MAANGGFCKFGSFQPYLTHRQVDWSTMMLIESPFLGHPTYLHFSHVVWWSTPLWTARTTKEEKSREVDDIILIFTTNFYNHFPHLQIGLIFFSQNRWIIKSKATLLLDRKSFQVWFWFWSNIPPLTLLLCIIVLLFNERAQSIVDGFNQHSHFLTLTFHRTPPWQPLPS